MDRRKFFGASVLGTAGIIANGRVMAADEGKQIKVFATVEDMASCETLVDGEYVITQGYHKPGDGGHGEYIIVASIANNHNGGTIINSFGASSFHAKLIQDGVINVKQFGAYADGIQNDSPFIQNALDAAVEEKLSVYISAGNYLLEQTLIAGNEKYSQLKIYGINRQQSVLQTTGNITALKVAHEIDISNLSIINADVNGVNDPREGIGIEIDYASYSSNFEKLKIQGFDKGVYGKWLIWDRFQDLIIRLVNTGVELHEHNGSTWNTEPNGWFNNVLVFDNVLVEYANIGFKLTAMGTQISNSTVQAANIGVWLQGVDGFKTFNNTVTNFYSETVKTVFKFKNAQHISINGFFAQGGKGDNPGRAVIDAENVYRIDVTGSTGQDFWEYSYILNNSNLYGNISAMGGSGYIAGESKHFHADRYFSLDALEADKKWRIVHHQLKMERNKTYRVSVSGVRDGYAPTVNEFLIYYFDQSLHKIMDVAGDGLIQLKIVDSHLYARLNYSGGHGLSSSKLRVEEV